MIKMRKNTGTVLEPSCGDGAFLSFLENYIAIEYDKQYSNPNILNMDFFQFPISNKFDTIIGNPPYVAYKYIPENIRKNMNAVIPKNFFDKRTNLYIMFIWKCLHHLKENGELIFITPRDFTKATSSAKLNSFLFSLGTITDFINLGDAKIFDGVQPNVAIWRFEKDNFSRKTGDKNFYCFNGQILFSKKEYIIPADNIFDICVGGVSGIDNIFIHEDGNEEFVFSKTRQTGKTRKMFYNIKNDYIEQYKEILINRKIRKFTENNWWKWGRDFKKTTTKRIYVNCKTRAKDPFFIHECNNYDGSILALFVKNQKVDLNKLVKKLNEIDWDDLGFMCGDRYLFSQKSLKNTLLPREFEEFV
jgi:adenine-specific DNA-methyltransferase